jgi:outer membrane protein OmpA-like peptidoglycan-associated protein
VIGLLGLTGCAAMQERRWSYCAGVGAGVGALVGAATAGGLVEGYEGGRPGGTDKQVGAAAGGGAGAGLVVGMLLGHLLCDPKEAPPPPPLAPPPPPPPPPAGKKITLAADSYFDFDKATLKPGGKERIDEVIRAMKDNPQLHVLVEGHTDSIGSDAYNQKLSERRANAVRDYLISRGIESTRITTRGLGESQPVADNKTKEGRAKNRRVDITTE